MFTTILRSLEVSSYDLVIASSSWYITRGFKVGPKTKVICYCHTPPRWLYGYESSVGFTKYWPVKIYSAVIGHFMRMYDFKVAQTVDFWIANSKNVAARIKKFYRKDSVVIYPPVEVKKIIEATKNLKREDYFLIVSRLGGAKGLEEAVKAARKNNFKLKIVGETHGFSDIEKRLKKMSGGSVELLGRVGDDELFEIYARARGFIALAKEEDFGITPVEAMAAGTPVIAFNSGGFRETVIDGKTGVLINKRDEKTMRKAIRRFNKINWDRVKLREYAKNFSKERFKKEFKEFVSKAYELRS